MFQVQPRVCGEYVIQSNIAIRLLGSTPRMRGILDDMSMLECKIGFNPAYAGNMLWFMLLYYRF